ncbi:MAG: Gfo/Idh/MocA family oxidoreductase [Oscillospiraceae bacterium]|jgi:predicted dehydrogenase|nr:Gfo/Idh/MocA family oxidoreductase [Oscillospiraceae bacterium]
MLRVAIIGTGNISPLHIKGYLTFPERCEIVALCDIVPEKCEEKKKTYGLDAAVYDSHKALLDGADVDLVSVCTPPFCHAEITVDCLRAGKHVIVEKPMAASLDGCDAMIAAAEAAVLSVVAQNRFRDPVRNLKRVLDSGLIGKTVHAQVDSHWWRGHCYYDLWWRGLWEKEGGGCTLNHAVHHIDMLGWMMGLPQSVCAMLSNAAHDNSEVEDVSVAVMRYAGGALAQVTSSVVHHGEEQQIIFQGEKARVSAPWKAVASLSQPNGFPQPNPSLEKELNDFYNALPALPHEGHTGQIDDVLTAIEAGAAPLIGGADGRRTVELITAIYKAASEGRTVTLPIAENDPFYTVEGILERVPRFYEKTTSAKGLGGGPITVGSDYRNKHMMGGTV